MWRELQEIPSKSQIALALKTGSGQPGKVAGGKEGRQRRERSIRRRVDLIQKPTAVVLRKHACETPRLVLEGLDVHDFHKEHISGFCVLDLEGAAQVVNLRQVDILDVVGRIIVTDLAASPGRGMISMIFVATREGERVGDLPVEAFDLHGFAVLDFGSSGD